MPERNRNAVDEEEVERFSRLAGEWWNPKGKFRPLHKFNPVRLAYIREQALNQFNLDGEDPTPFKGLRFADIGCGGGLLCEPLARLGAEVVGVDPSEVNVEVARLHAKQESLNIDYRAQTAGDLAGQGEKFDATLAMEVVEHVADVNLFLSQCAAITKPNGILIVATINRTFKAWALAIIGAEIILKWLPKGTHQFEKLVKPEEIIEPLEKEGMEIIEKIGTAYNPLADEWRLSNDTDVNYMILARRR